MADFSTLIASIEATIKQNGVQAITGQVLQDELLLMVSAINQLKQDTLEGYAFYGEPLPNGATRVVTQNTFFLAGAGSYTINGNAVTIADSGISVIVYDCVNDEITTYQLFAYDANPTSGSGNAVTSGGVYNALAGKQALVPAATEGNLAEFDNAGQVRDAGIATTDLATKDGHYPNLFAGFAGNLVDTRSAGTRQGPFAFRQSGGDGVNYMRKILGRTLAWNQLVKNGNFENTTDGWTKTANIDISVNNNVASVTASAVGDNFVQQILSLVVGHKYYVKVETRSTSPSDIVFYCFYGSGGDYYVLNGGSSDSFIKQGRVITCASNQYNLIRLACQSVSITNYYRNVMVIDLTLLYGSEIAGLTDAQILAKFEKDYPLAYYNDNAGVLKNNAATGLETTGFNQWDEEIEDGAIGTDGQPTTLFDYFRSKNFIPCFPSTNYYFKDADGDKSQTAFFYDADGNFISYTTAAIHNAIFITPANCYKMKFCRSDKIGYSQSICINLSDASRNGTYEPYWKREIVLGITGVTGIPEGGTEADRVTIFPNGLAGVGTAQDMFYEENGVAKAKKVMGSVDLGTLTPSGYSNPDKRVYYSGITYIKSYGALLYPKGLKGDVSASSPEWNIFFESNVLYIRVNSYTDAATFKTAMSGVMLNYELASPIVYTDLQNADGTPFVFPKMVEVDNLGTEKRLPEDTADNPQAPFECDSNYSISTANLVRKLIE